MDAWRASWRRRQPTVVVDVVVDAAGAWGDVVAARAGVAPLGLRPLRRTACLVPAPPESAPWPLVMDVGGRFYFEPESGGLLLSPADEHPSEPLDATAEMEDVAWALEMLPRRRRSRLATCAARGPGLRTFAPDRVPVVGWDTGRAGLLLARRPGGRRHQDRAGDGGRGGRDRRRQGMAG